MLHYWIASFTADIHLILMTFEFADSKTIIKYMKINYLSQDAPAIFVFTFLVYVILI